MIDDELEESHHFSSDSLSDDDQEQFKCEEQAEGLPLKLKTPGRQDRAQKPKLKRHKGTFENS